jgi:Potassium-transporting ATPase A subunit
LNPTGFTNLFDLLLVIVLPFAIVFMFGRIIGRRKQALVIAGVMAAIFLVHTTIAMQAELHGNSMLPAGVQQVATATNPGGNMEGKEMRFGASGSALMTVGTMGTTAGATDSALDSYTRSAARPRSPRSCSARSAPAATAAACTASSCSRCSRCSSPASWSAGHPSSSARRSARRR